MNSKGFTLMEILAVLLILAVVIMFALPGIRAVRNEIYYLQAKSAAVKMADAMRSYYQNTKGFRIAESGGEPKLVGKIPAAGGSGLAAETAGGLTCNDVAAAGFPASAVGGISPVSQLFACDYISVKDFRGLPYVFEVTDELFNGEPSILVKATGLAEAGRHNGDSWCVYRDASVAECE